MSCYERMHGNGKATQKNLRQLRKQCIAAYNRDVSNISSANLKKRRCSCESPQQNNIVPFD